jgi:hypothetical protein
MLRDWKMPVQRRKLKSNLFAIRVYSHFMSSPQQKETIILSAQLLCRDLSLAERILKTLATTKYEGPDEGEPGAFSEATIASILLHTRAKGMTAVAGATE